MAIEKELFGFRGIKDKQGIKRLITEINRSKTTLGYLVEFLASMQGREFENSEDWDIDTQTQQMIAFLSSRLEIIKTAQFKAEEKEKQIVIKSAEST